ncbi:bifunctional hydroxymethylpyrimidine kinase/phosphomethylpyrimidine kinase [Ruminococcaceae bacterium OttesenSCG-928-D13]|nr:bifunctional hydroxymethylpyrimidine kinase/phosphomethylpyrimidine kinase [Ruminococcaceae bacterium OttesenSCG-928-D13]
MKKVLCIMDLSSVGRAGLAVVLPALSAAGVQGCGLPAALFSTHTGGFGPVEKLDGAAWGAAALDHYARAGVDFDAVYIGYLYGEGQFALARQALAQYPKALHVVDPALGDAGKAYNGLGADTVERMLALCSAAQLITPNYTESAMLTGQTPDTAPPEDAVFAARMDKLAENGRAVLVTSVPTRSGGFETRGRTAEGRDFVIPNRHVPVRFPGSGDLLCAATLGLMLGRELDLEAAARAATRFVEKAVHTTHAAGADPRFGLDFEPLLGMLANPDFVLE